ncbi:hypothetical protein BD769DRAFT_1662778 [Suillus cothurnatus]|nr:hypothetical protein BD769DRAFT_1662778 [Suillus cothurnatus]
MATLTEEINFIWRRPKALSAIAFLVNRYFALLGNIYGLFFTFMPIPEQRFELLTLEYLQLFIFFQQFIVGVILIIRTYALYNCSKRMLFWTTLIFVILAGGSSAGAIGQYAGNLTISPGVGCYETYTVEVYVIILAPFLVCSKVVADLSVSCGLAWLAMFAFELLIFVLTVRRTCKTRGLLRFRLTGRRNALDVIFHDGAMYFGAMTLCNIPNIVMYYSALGIVRGSLGLATFTSCMSVTLISRLMLNLHESIDSGIFSVPTQDDEQCLSILTTEIDAQSTIGQAW